MADGIVNKNLYETTKALTESALRLLGSYIEKGEVIPVQTMEVHKVTGPGAWSQDYEEKPQFWRFAYRHEKEVRALPEFDDWMRVIREDSVVAKHLDGLVGTSQGSIRRTPWEYPTYLLEKQLQAWPTELRFDVEIFDRGYQAIERFVYAEMLGFRALAPLQNFAAEVEVVNLGESLRIRKIANKELEELLDASAYGSMIPFGEIPSYRYAMELEYEIGKVFGMFKLEDIKPTPDLETFGKLVTALRLFKPGTLGFNNVQTIPLADTPGVFGGMRGGLEYKRFWGAPYDLSGAEVGAFKEFWKDFNKLDLRLNPELAIAVSRFNYAYERRTLEDKLIDYMIAFEALFFKTGEVGENRHKLSVRVARLLARDFESRRTVSKEMAEFYDERSKVVHGEKTSFKGELVEKVERYLRESIKHFIHQGRAEDHDEIISQLDLE